MIRLPKFPRKTVKRKFGAEFIKGRQIQLEEWLQAVVNFNILSGNSIVMEFLGALQDLNKMSKKHQFKRLACKLWVNKAQTGDVILFRTNGFFGSGFRKMTSCEYDHIAMVVVLPSNWASIDSWDKASSVRSAHLLEATREGTKTYRLRTRLRQWDFYCSRIVFRALTFKRSEDYEKEAFEFTKSVTGMNYAVRVTEIVRRKSFSGLEDRSGFFCSELVAAFYKKIGLFPFSKSANTYYPSSFTGNGLELQKGATWENEIMLTFHNPAVDKSSLKKGYRR